MAIETGFLVAILFGKVRGEGTGALIRKGHGWTLQFGEGAYSRKYGIYLPVLQSREYPDLITFCMELTCW